MLTDFEFLRDQGGVNPNTLNNKINMNNAKNDENYQIHIIKHSSYFDIERLNYLIKSKGNWFSIFSTNI